MNLNEFKGWEEFQEYYIDNITVLDKEFYKLDSEMVKDCLIILDNDGDGIGEFILQLTDEAIKYATNSILGIGI